MTSKASQKKVVKGWVAVVPGTLVPFSSMQSECAIGTRQYVVFCDKDAKARARELTQFYPEKDRLVVPCEIHYSVPKKK